MFQRIKGAIDSTIAEEKARQRLSQASPQRPVSNSKRNTSRATSPSKKAPRQGARGRQDGDPPSKGPDPADFDPEFVIEDDDLSRSGTPRPPVDRNGGAAAEKASEGGPRESRLDNNEAAASTDEPRTSSDLPTDVRAKLRKLDKLESRYHELLRSYRVAHARVLTIEPFETSLRENTPLTSVSDPKALVEYLNQINLKGDMVLDELKRVSGERDTYKQKLGEAEKSARQAWDEVTNLRIQNDARGESEEIERQVNSFRSEDDQELDHGDPLGATSKSPPPSVKSPTISVRGISLFSSKSKAAGSPKVRQGSEDIFSYDSEIPRLESELHERGTRIDSLEYEVKSLKGDLAVTRESTQSMVQTLEEATRELNGLRDSKDRSSSELQEQQASSEQVRADLHIAERKLQELQNSTSSQDTERINKLEEQLGIARRELDNVHSSAGQDTNSAMQVEELHSTTAKLETELVELLERSKKSGKKIETLNNLVSSLRKQLTAAEDKNQDLSLVIDKSSKAYEILETKLEQLEASSTMTGSLGSPAPADDKTTETSLRGLQTTSNDHSNAPDTSNASKKKNKKKKKGGKTSVEQDTEVPADLKNETDPKIEASAERDTSGTAAKLQEELRQIRVLLEEKDAAIHRTVGKLKDQDGLREEIEILRDDLVNVGQEHVEVRDTVKNLTTAKSALEITVADLEKELAELRNSHATNTAGSEQKHRDLTAHFEDLKSKATTLQTDLLAAQQLASSRFKDLNDLRNVLQKAQPEINALRSEAVEVKTVKEALVKKDAEFIRLESRHEEIRSEVTGLKKTIADRDSQIKTLSQKISQESGNRIKAEEAGFKAAQDVQRLESENRQATEALDRLSSELAKMREGLSSSRTKLKDSEQQLYKTRSDSEGMKEEFDLKSAQYASAQSLMASMRDQTAEMATQMKEARERCESLDEEVADAHRLLGERSREGETMRRLLADVEGRADTRIREMKERMDTAIEERDRAEDEASTASRRRAREIEELRNKYRDMERNLKRAEEDKEELEIAQRDWKRRREELESRASQSTKETDEVRKAMGELRDALDESERQARDLEKGKTELRRSVEDTQHRLEMLQKSNKSMADEISKTQTAKTKAMDSEAHSSRSSLETPSRLGSPAPKSRNGSAALIDAPNGHPPGAMDYVYLKNVLLQFLEQKDKKHQMQLVPVLGMLLHFDRKDEQKWMSAINTKA